MTQLNTQPAGNTGGQQTQQQTPQGQQGGQPQQGDPNTQGGGQQQTQQTQQGQQAGGQQQPDPALDARLDALLGAGQQQQQGQTGQGQQGGQQGQQTGGDDLRAWLSGELGTMRQSISDSVRNSILNEMRRTGQQPPDPGQQNQQQGQGQQPQQSAPQRPAGPDPMDLREARMAFTQYLGDTRQFASADERAIGNTLGAQLVTQELAGGGTPDAAARKAATEVAAQLEGFVAAVETRVTNRLRERGQLVSTDGSQPAGTNTPTTNLDSKRTWATDLAKQYNAQTNPPAPGQQAG